MAQVCRTTNCVTESTAKSKACQSPFVGAILGGLAGGLIFGMMMAAMGMLPTVAGLVGSKSAVVGGIVHLMISVILGLGFLVIARKTKRPIMLGILYGVILWALFPLTMMPLMMVMPLPWSVQGIIANMPSLMGHAIYGLALGWVFGKFNYAHSLRE